MCSLIHLANDNPAVTMEHTCVGMEASVEEKHPPMEPMPLISTTYVPSDSSMPYSQSPMSPENSTSLHDDLEQGHDAEEFEWVDWLIIYSCVNDNQIRIF